MILAGRCSCLGWPYGAEACGLPPTRNDGCHTPGARGPDHGAFHGHLAANQGTGLVQRHLNQLPVVMAGRLQHDCWEWLVTFDLNFADQRLVLSDRRRAGVLRAPASRPGP